MSRRMLSCLAASLVCLGMAVLAEENPRGGPMTENLVAKVDSPPWLLSMIRDACPSRPDRTAADGSLIKVSPDGRRVAYVVPAGDQAYVVVDGREQKRYDAILQGTLVFSPDGKRAAYGARLAGKCFVVMDGKEGKP